MANENQQIVVSIIPPDSMKIISFLQSQGLTKQLQAFCKEKGYDYSTVVSIDNLIADFKTQDKLCLKMLGHVKLLSAQNDTVLIQGETGTGKELIAEALHGARKGEFVAINCAGMPEQLIESELFGHTQGAFTGANATKPGLIEIASGGTLFLDEIGDLGLPLQAKLLRVMQNKTIRKVGDKTEKVIDVRFVCATHFDLKELVEKKLFRQDLFARVSTFVLRIPPLRDRLNDIPLLLKQYDKTNQLVTLITDWSKIDLSLNVRSLQSICRQFAVLQKLPL